MVRPVNWRLRAWVAIFSAAASGLLMAIVVTAALHGSGTPPVRDVDTVWPEDVTTVAPTPGRFG